MIFLKLLFKQPLTSADLHQLASKNLAHPPLPKEMYDASASLVGTNGTSLLDVWRRHFSAQLDKIAVSKTWRLQRAKLLQIVLSEQQWNTGFVCTKDIPTPDVWAHLVEEVEWFKKSPKAAWQYLMLQRYIVSLMSWACMMELGGRAFLVDKKKQLEIELHGDYEKGIMQLDLRFLELIKKCVDNYDDETAQALATMKDDVINPLIADQYKLLSLMGEQIVHSEIDVTAIKAQMAAFDVRKREIAESLPA